MNSLKLLLAVSTSIVLVANPVSALAQSKKTNKPLTDEASKELCKDKLSNWDIKQLGIGDVHKFKQEFLGENAQISRYDLCKCKDKSVTIRELKCTGKGQIETGYKLP